MRRFSLILIGLFLVGNPGFSKATSSREGEAVILLHGLGRTHRSMRRLESGLKKKGYTVHNLHYKSRKKSITELVDGFLTQAIETYGASAQKLHFVGHSLGGILIRSYLQDRKIRNLGRIVMLSPPNHGSEVTDKLSNWMIYRSYTGMAGQQLGTKPDSWPQQLGPIEAEIGIITGNRSDNWIFSSIIPGPDDGKVSVESAKLDEMKDFLVLPLNHTVIMANKHVLIQAAHFLETGRFAPEKLPKGFR